MCSRSSPSGHRKVPRRSQPTSYATCWPGCGPPSTAASNLVDPFTILVATGLRRCELLALRWSDFDETAGTLAVTGKVVRVTGEGLMRVDETKTAAGRRTIALPRFAVRGTAAATLTALPR